MAIQVGGTTVIDNSRNLQNVQGIKTVGGQSILGSGDISTGSTPGTFAEGALWQTRRTGGSGTFYNVIYGNNLWIVTKEGGTGFTSTNAESWTQRSFNISQTYRQMYDIAYDGTTFVVMGESSRTANSTNGTSWTERTTSDFGDMYGVCAGSTGKFVAVGTSGKIIRSTNSGNTFSTVTSGTSQFLRGVEGRASNGYMVAVGNAGTILRSTNNGSSWSARTSPTSDNLYDVATDGAGKWAAVGDNGTIVYSTNDGGAWSLGNSQTTKSFKRVAYANGTWVAIGGTGAISVTSNPASAWLTQGVSPVTNQLNGVAGNSSGLFLAVGTGATVIST